jgi:hypothetical protein
MRTDRQLNGSYRKGSDGCSQYPRYPQAGYRKFCFRESESMCIVTKWSERTAQSLPNAGNGGKDEEGPEEPISAGRRLDRNFGSCSGPAGKRRRKRKLPLARRGSRVSFRNRVSKAGRKSGFPKKGRGISDGFDRETGSRTSDRKIRIQGSGQTDRLGNERQANLREAQSSRGPAPLRRERYGGKRRLSW